MAQPCHPVATWRWWQMCNLSEVEFFIGVLTFLPIDSDLTAWKKIILLLLSDKNESYYFHTSWSTNKQGFGNLDRKTSPIKMWFKRNICKGSIKMGLICDVWKIYDCEKFPVSFGRSDPRWNPRWSERSEWNLGYESQRIIAHRRCRLTSTRERNIVADRTHLRSSLVFTRHHPTFAALHVGIRRGPHLWCSLV